MVFIRSVAFKLIVSLKRGYVYVCAGRQKCAGFAGMLFNLIINITIFLVLKGVARVFLDF